MIRLAIEAPFAACRPMMAGWHRPTAGFLTHSAAYGLILNVAGVESRLGEHEPGHPGGVPASVTRPGLPRFRLALGLPEGAELPGVGSVFQQLHVYSVGAGNAGIRPEFAQGRKNNITPVRRALLCELCAVAVIRADEDFEELVRRGLRGERNSSRYGLPFLGDNSFTPDRLDEAAQAPARWLTPAGAGRATDRRHLAADRLRRSRLADRHQVGVFSPALDPSPEPPESALVPVGDPASFDEWAAAHLPA